MEEKKKKKSLKDNIQMVIDLWNYMLKRWIIICIFGFGGGALGLLVAALKKPTYESKLSFVLDAQGNSQLPGGLSGLAGSIGLGGVGTGESVFEGDNLIALLGSKPIVENAPFEKGAPQKNHLCRLFDRSPRTQSSLGR